MIWDNNEVRLNSGDCSFISGKPERYHFARFSFHIARVEVPAGLQLLALQSHSYSRQQHQKSELNLLGTKKQLNIHKTNKPTPFQIFKVKPKIPTWSYKKQLWSEQKVFTTLVFDPQEYSFWPLLSVSSPRGVRNYDPHFGQRTMTPFQLPDPPCKKIRTLIWKKMEGQGGSDPWPPMKICLYPQKIKENEHKNQ